MAETQLLRSSAIVRNATVAPPQHGPVKTGALPLVQVRMAPGGPQIQEGQQKPVTILPPRDAASAVVTGGLPMVQVKMTQNGPQLDNGRDQPVLIRDGKMGSVNAGGLPMIQVKMDGGKPQVQTVPNVQNGPPRIPGAAPVVSAPRTAGPAVPSRQVVSAPGRHVVAAPTRQVTAAPQVELPPVPELSIDQLMLCRHRVHEALVADIAAARPTELPTELRPESDAIKFARLTVDTIDDILVATAVHAEAEALAAAAAATAPAVAAVPRTQNFAASTSISPAPSAAYVAGRVGNVRPQQGYTAGGRTQRNSGMAPRRVARDGAPLPPVIVKMDGKRPVVQVAPVVEVAPGPEAVVEVMATEAVAAEVVESPPVTAPETAPLVTAATATATDTQG
jgi:hypothetical protein